MTAPLPAATPARDRAHLDDPAAFARDLDARFGDALHPHLVRVFDELDPALYALRDNLGPNTEHGKVAGAIHDAVSNAIMDAFDAGVAFGAAAETVRRSLMIPSNRTPGT